MKKGRLRAFIFVFLILLISIGFAVLSSNLSINGLFNFSSNTWKISLKNVVVDDTSVTKTAPTINQDEDTITFSAELDKPGDYYSFNFDVLNESTLDAMLGSIAVSGITSQYSDYLSCVVSYSNGTTPNPNDILYKTARVTLNVKLLYKDITTSQIPENVLNPTITITINYRQANNNAVLVADTNHWNFDYTESSQEFSVPLNGTYKIELWGAQGGTVDNYIGGKGGYTSGKIQLTKEKLYIYVGERKEVNNTGSFNGSLNSTNAGAAGGGATDIRLVKANNWYDFLSLKSRIMVASGGGAHSKSAYPGAAGGGLIGYRALGVEGRCSYPGTQLKGGNETCWGSFSGYNSIGYFGQGSKYGAGGGSGYFGGAGGNHVYGGGSGGSSFISGHSGCVAIDESSTEDNIIFKTDTSGVDCSSSESSTYNSDGYNTDQKCSIHYSNKAFTDSLMIDGQGYRWTTVKANTPQGMPNKNGIGTVTGNTGNGFARITYIG